MPYVVGIVLSLGVALFARRVRFDRDRAFRGASLVASLCLAYDLGAAGGLAWVIRRGPRGYSRNAD
jgi:hypothetical protein